jgi:phosphatidylinositol-3-phosphatase
MFRNSVRRAATAVGLLVVASLLMTVSASAVLVKRSSSEGFPRYDHVFLLIEENHNYNQIIGNPAAPEINALARDYGLATRYSGVADPSGPNYVAMLGGSAFGIHRRPILLARP